MIFFFLLLSQAIFCLDTTQMYSIIQSMESGISERKASGFASPAQGYEEQSIDLNRLLVKNPPATYFFRMESEEMAALGLQKGSLLIVDRSKKPLVNSFALIRHEGRFLCRQMLKQNGITIFTNGINIITPLANETEIIGTVTASINEYNQ